MTVLCCLQIALSKLALPCGRDFVEQLMKQYDYDRDGKITFPEFCQYVGDRQNLMARAFHQLDSDTNGQHLGAIDTETLVRLWRQSNSRCQPGKQLRSPSKYGQSDWLDSFGRCVFFGRLACQQKRRMLYT